jgi:hypothetical protein
VRPPHGWRRRQVAVVAPIGLRTNDDEPRAAHGVQVLAAQTKGLSIRTAAVRHDVRGGSGPRLTQEVRHDALPVVHAQH